jgi:antitoxin component YwqK of YwqJK toxin-antitoxin module
MKKNSFTSDNDISTSSQQDISFMEDFLLTLLKLVFVFFLVLWGVVIACELFKSQAETTTSTTQADTATTDTQPQLVPTLTQVHKYTMDLLASCEEHKDGVAEFKHDFISPLDAKVYCHKGKFEKIEVYQGQERISSFNKEKIFEEYNNGKVAKRIILERISDVAYIYARHLEVLQQNAKYTFETYYPNSKIESRTQYDHGQGTAKFYDKTGRLAAKIDVRNGSFNGKWEEYYQNGKIKLRGSIAHDKRDGPYVEYYENGKIKFLGFYFKDMREGSWEVYYENGKINSRGSYSKDMKDGLWETFYPNGNIAQREHYQHGKSNGEKEWFYTNGNLHAVANLVNGKINGILEEYDLYGPMKKRVNFQDGKAVSGTYYHGEEGREMSRAELYNEFNKTTTYK